MDAEQQQFCLRWHNHQSSVLGGLPALLDSGKLTDVTLCAGGRSLRAHRIVLSACSPYFMDLFKDLSSSQQPVVVVLGGGWAELCCLVAFMYAGEVTLPRDLLPSLLKLAAALKITGLTDLNGNVPEEPPRRGPSEATSPEDEGEDPLSAFRKPPEATSESRTRKIDRIVENLKCNRRKAQEPRSSARPDFVPDVECQNVKTEPKLCAGKSRPFAGGDSMETDADRPSEDAAPASGSGRNGSSADVKPFATCYVCHKKLSNQYNLRVHLETHQNARHACVACSHVSRSRDALRKHVSYRHPQLSSSHGVGRPCKAARSPAVADSPVDFFAFPEAPSACEPFDSEDADAPYGSTFRDPDGDN